MHVHHPGLATETTTWRTCNLFKCMRSSARARFCGSSLSNLTSLVDMETSALSSSGGCRYHHWQELMLAWMVSPLLLASCIVAGVVAWLWWHRAAQRGVPGPKGWPVIGCTLEVIANFPRMHDWYLEQYSRHSTKTFYLASAYPLVGVFTVDPANVEYILKTNFANYPKGKSSILPLQELLGSGIFAANGAQWKEQRRVASYEFSSATLRDFSTVAFRDYAVKLVSILARFASSAESFDLQDLCFRMTLDSTCRIGFGVDLDSLSPSLPCVPFATCFDEASYISAYRLVDPLWQLKRTLNVGKERKLKECVKVLDDFTFDIINRRRKDMAATSSHKASSDLLSRFIDMCKHDNEPGSAFTNKALRDVVLNFLIAGRDTTALTLSWFFYMMICHPEVAQKIVEELVTVTEQPASQHHTQEVTEEEIAEFAELLTYETLGKLHYLHAALSETLRLYPAVPVDAKEAVQDDVLPDGSKVKKGSITGFVPYSMGRMTELWGDDAADFKPCRWLKDGVFQPQPLFKFTAFQAGPRTCLGKDFAYLQMKMTTALVLRFFSFQLVPGHPIHYRTMLVLTLEYGLRVTTTLRV